MSSELLDRYDELTSNFSTGKPDMMNVKGNVFSILGDSNKFLEITYEALLKRPDLFGENALTFLYALDVGQTFRKEGLEIMFSSFLSKPPQTTESNVLFLYAATLKQYNKFVSYEPVFDKLNKCIALYMDKKTFNYKGRELPTSTFKPFLYNEAGVNLIELIPYIAYIFTYHTYGYPITFSDVYSSSSLKSYLVSLEGYFTAQYMKLYDEHNISILNASMKQNEIDDQTWKDFYTVLLDSKKIIELRNREINKTANVLNQMIETQQSLNEVDLYKRYDAVIGKLVELCIKKSPLSVIYSKIPEFDAKYFNADDIVNLTAYMMSENNTTHIIETVNNFKYVHCEEPTKYDQIPFKKPSLGYNKLTYSFNRPFASGDIIADMFKGYLRTEFKNKKEDILDDDPLWINPSDIKPEIYDFLMPFFVCGCWELEGEEMKIVMNNMNKSVLQDIKDAHMALKTVYGETFGTLITPIYFISFINEFARDHCELELPFNEFNPFVYLLSRTPDINRVYKLRDMATSMCYIMNKTYIDYANRLNAEFYDLFTTNTLIIQPYVQGIDNDASIFALGGVETYDYLKYSNPFTRGYGFLNNIMGCNEKIDIVYTYLSQINNDVIIDLINDSKDDLTTISNNVLTYIKKNQINCNKLYKYNFDEECNYKLRPNDYFLDYKDIMEMLLKYSYNQTIASDVLEAEQVRVKCFKINSKNELETSVSTANGYPFGSGFINLRLNSHGSTRYLPIYSLSGKIEARNLSIVNPNGMRCVQIITNSTGTVSENNVFWIYTQKNKVSSFTKKVALRKNAVHPKDAEYMLADRIEAVYRN